MDRIGIIMHGVTGRMGYNQHLVRSILAIRDQGGIASKSGVPPAGRSDHRRPQRGQDAGEPYACDADDAAYATFQLANGVIAQFNSSWAVRIRRDDLVTFQVDGTHGSAVAGLTTCRTQARVNTPRPVWNPDQPSTIDFFKAWEEVPQTSPNDNGFKEQWELYLRHVAEDGPWRYGLEDGAKGVQVAELGLKSWAVRRWLDVPALEF